MISGGDFKPFQPFQNFYHFPRSNTNRFSQNIFRTPDDTWKSLYKLSHNTDIVVLQGDKDSSVVIMYKQQYIHKLESMIEDGVSDGKYQPTSDNTLQDLKSFQDFLYRNIRPLKSEVLPYDKIRPTSSQPGYLYATAKTHKVSNHKDITADKIKLRPIVSACGTSYYETAKSLASYLSPLATNEHTINSTLNFADLLKVKTLEQDEIMVSYDVNSLFTEIPLDETIDYVIDQIYNERKLAPLMSKTIFKRLLERVTKGSVFSFNNKLYKQTDGCGMGNPLSPVLANIFMCKLEEHIIPKHSPAEEEFS